MTHYGLHRTRIFKEIFKDKQEFYTEYMNIGLGGFKDNQTLDNLYTLLYARRGNDAIFSTDETQFKYKLFSIIFQYGPDYEKRLEIQKRIREMSDAELQQGTISVFNQAQNPSTLPGTSSFEPLHKIDAQSAQTVKRSKAEYLSLQNDLLDTRFIDVFLKRFDSLFNPFPTELPLLYDIGGFNDDDDDSN